VVFDPAGPFLNPGVGTTNFISDIRLRMDENLTKPLSNAYLDEVRKRCDAATEGPWISFVEDRDHVAGDNFIGRGVNRRKDDLYLTGATDEDQDFIAYARQDIPLLLDEIERLQKLLDEKAKEDK